MPIRRIDREALKRAMQLAMANDPGRREQLKSKLQDEPWDEVAMFAAFCCQTEALHLKPWQPPPCEMSDDRPRDEHPSAGRVAAWELRRRLIKAGLSMYELDPAAALETVAVRQRDRAQHLAPNGAKPNTRPPMRDSRGQSVPLDFRLLDEPEAVPEPELGKPS